MGTAGGVAGINSLNTSLHFKVDKLTLTHASAITVNPFTSTTTMTGAATTGGRALFQMNADAALGGWSNALKAYVVYGSSGSTSGLGSALVAELKLSAGTTTGTYAPLESEIVVSSSGSTGTATSFLYMNVDDDSSTFAANGYLFEMGSGIADSALGMFYGDTQTGIAKTHTLKIRIAGTTYYIALHTARNFK